MYVQQLVERQALLLIEFAGAIGSILNIGDNVYAATLAAGVATTDPIFVGQVTFKTSTSITVDTTVPGGSTANSWSVYYVY